VELFLEEKIGYLDIMKYVGACCEAHQAEHVVQPTLDEIVHYDGWARQYTEDAISKATGGMSAAVA
jgi:1-deoxy-D-xylulose-5-phosphate reductoisomerase